MNNPLLCTVTFGSSSFRTNHRVSQPIHDPRGIIIKFQKLERFSGLAVLGVLRISGIAGDRPILRYHNQHLLLNGHDSNTFCLCVCCIRCSCIVAHPIYKNTHIFHAEGHAQSILILLSMYGAERMFIQPQGNDI